MKSIFLRRSLYFLLPCLFGVVAWKTWHPKPELSQLRVTLPAHDEASYLRTVRVLHGSIFGSDGAAGHSFVQAFDGNSDTYFAAKDRGKGYVGIALSAPTTVDAVRWLPRPGYESSMGGGVFEGSNRANDAGFHPFLILGDTPPAGWYLWRVQSSRPYKFLRYRGPRDSRCDIAEIQFLSKKN